MKFLNRKTKDFARRLSGRWFGVRAEALHRRIFPWMLDDTPLPSLLEVQAIKEPDGAKVAHLLRPYLGWTLTRRRLLQGLIAGVLAVALGLCTWYVWFQPAPNWEFDGRITDLSNNPIAGVKADVTTYDGNGRPVVHTVRTDGDGKYLFKDLPPPMPDKIPISYGKPGYDGKTTVVNANHPFDTPMAPEEPAQE